MQERDPDPLVSEAEQEAASEARRIGGRAGDEDLDPAQRPVSEGGGGEAEGFEIAEEDLVDHAEYTSGEGAPRLERLMGEEEEQETARRGEADEEDVSEVVRDPAEGPDDPGAGPGIAHDR